MEIPSTSGRNAKRQKIELIDQLNKICETTDEEFVDENLITVPIPITAKKQHIDPLNPLIKDEKLDEFIDFDQDKINESLTDEQQPHTCIDCVPCKKDAISYVKEAKSLRNSIADINEKINSINAVLKTRSMEQRNIFYLLKHIKNTLSGSNVNYYSGIDRKEFILKFPLRSISSIIQLESELLEKRFAINLIKYLRTLKSTDSYEIKKAFRYLITDELLLQHEWNGSSDKDALNKYKFFSKILPTAWCCEIYDKEQYISDVLTVMKMNKEHHKTPIL